MSSVRQQATRLLAQTCHGAPGSAEELLPLIYGELRALAGSMLVGERVGHTLSATALVHEAWLRLVDHTTFPSEDGEAARRKFIGYAAHSMRNVLVDYARRRNADKRGGDRRRVTLSDVLPVLGADCSDILDLDEALATLGRQNERMAKTAELRLFGGLSLAEVAMTLGISLTVTKTEWGIARAVLARLLSPEDGGAEPNQT